MASETPIVKLLADGGIECAKGLELSECGYKPGAKVCGKCGAKAVTETEEAVPADAAPEVATEKSEWVTAGDEKVAKMAHEETEMAEEEMPAPKKKKKPGMHKMPDGTMMKGAKHSSSKKTGKKNGY